MDQARRVVLLLMVPVLTFALVVGVAMTGSAKPKPAATVTPRTDLVDFTGDGQYVTISWKGFPGGVDVYARQCARGANDIGGQCSQGGFYSACGRSCPGTVFLGGSDRDGAGAASTRVAVGAINLEPNLDPIDGRTFECDHTDAHPCSLFVLWDVNDLEKGIEVPLTFSPPLSACPPAGTSIPGAGGGPAFRQFQGWSLDVCQRPTQIGLQYTLQFSGSDAVQTFVDSVENEFSSSADTYFAATTQPATKRQQAVLDLWQARTAYAPVTASGLVFGYRLFDRTTGGQIRDLVLTPEILARIFSRQLTTWNDRTIEKLNPGVDFPSSITVYGRGDACEETLQMTRWFDADPASEKAWEGGGEGLDPNPFAEPDELLPSLGQISLVTGAKAMANAVALDPADLSTFGSIGYMDSSWAALYNLPTAQIRLANGQTVEATPQTLRAAAARMVADDGGVAQPDYEIKDERSWPLPTVSYMLVPFDSDNAITKPSDEVRDALGTLLDFIATTAQGSVPAGYAPLPDELVEQTAWVAASMEEEQERPSTSPSPTSSPSTGPTPSATSTPTPTSAASSPTGFPVSSSSSAVLPTPPPISAPAPTPSPVPTIIVQPVPPPAELQRSSSRLVLPAIAGLGVASSLAGAGLLYSDGAWRPGRRRKKRRSAS